MNDWVVIFETGQLYRAELVKSLLNDNNVEAVILNQKDSSFKTVSYTHLTLPTIA